MKLALLVGLLACALVFQGNDVTLYLNAARDVSRVPAFLLTMIKPNIGALVALIADSTTCPILTKS